MVPVSIFSIIRFSARHDEPRRRSSLDTGAAAKKMVPAVNARVLQMCESSSARGKKEKRISAPASGSPNLAPLSRVTRRQVAPALSSRHHQARRASPRPAKKRGGRLRVEEAEALLQLGWDEVAKGHVVGQHDEPDVSRGVLPPRAHRRIAEDDGDLRLEVEAPSRVLQRDVIGRTEQHAGAALIDQRIRAQGRRAASAPRALRTRTIWLM